jgi:tRNA(Ile)-lysidine synthase
MRLAVGLSGGADSVALLCALAERSADLGLVLHAAHLHHGLRGAEADGDLAFARALAERLGVPFHEARVDVAAEAEAKSQTVEEAARCVRYAWFRRLLSEVPLDAVATAHTRDDQAETVLAKFLRGAWTEGLSGIHPVLEFPEGRVIRPLLSATRGEIESHLRGLGQEWREDSSNRHLTFTRNRIRHELLPVLEGWNPRLREHLTEMATLARDEEAWWQVELGRIGPQLLMTGRPVRGGGRAAGQGISDGLAIDVTRLAALPVALQRRLLRHAANQLGAGPDFAATEALRTMALGGRASQKLELHGLHAERTPREMRLSIPAGSGVGTSKTLASGKTPETIAEHRLTIPGEVVAPEFGVRLRIEPDSQRPAPASVALLRGWRAGDRVRLRYSSGPRKVKEVLERLKVTGSSRAAWPVVEIDGRIVWMKGVELEPEPDIRITVWPDSDGQIPSN